MFANQAQSRDGDKAKSLWEKSSRENKTGDTQEPKSKAAERHGGAEAKSKLESDKVPAQTRRNQIHWETAQRQSADVR